MERKSAVIKNVNINYKIDYRNIKYPRIEFKTGEPIIILPKKYQREDSFLKRHWNWISKKHFLIKSIISKSKSKKLYTKRTKGDLKSSTVKFVNKYSKKLNVKIRNVYFRKMKTKWASCSPRGNLTINTLLKYLPNTLIEYIIFHEMLHRLEKRHNERFWYLMNKTFKNYEKYEKELFIYWFLICKQKVN